MASTNPSPDLPDVLQTLDVGAPHSRMAPTAAKAFRVVELLAEEPTRAFPLAEMRRRLGYSHGNLHAICTTLVAMGHLRREAGERAYRLGPSLLSIGVAARTAYPSVEIAMPFLQTLAAEFDTEAHAAMRAGDTIVVVARVGRPLTEYGVHVGQRFPLVPPLGSTFVAWADAEQREAYLASAGEALTPAEIERCRAALAATVERGYSIHTDVEPGRMVRATVERIRDEATTAYEPELRALVQELGRHDYQATEAGRIRAGDHLQVSAPAFAGGRTVELSVGLSLRVTRDGLDAVGPAGERVMATARMITRAIDGLRSARSS